jgi:NADH-ubiquinone oxidoreductase chain 5
MGTPFLSGFYSKDLIIELQAGSYMDLGSFFFLLITISACLTAFYSARLVFYVFLNRPLWQQQLQISEASWWVQSPLLVLAFLSIFSGYAFEDFFVGVGSTFFASSLFYHPQHWYSLLPDYIPYFSSQLPLIGSLFGVWLSFQTFRNRSYYYYYYYYYYYRMAFFTSRWGFDFFYNRILLTSLFTLITHFYYFLDKGLIEYFGPTGLYFFVNKTSQFISCLQTGSLTRYLQVITGFFVLCLCCFPLFLQI